MDEAYKHVSWTYPSEPEPANRTDENVRVETVIHHHYHHHYHHSSPPPPHHREQRRFRTPPTHYRYTSPLVPRDTERGSHSPRRRRQRSPSPRPRVATRQFVSSAERRRVNVQPGTPSPTRPTCGQRTPSQTLDSPTRHRPNSRERNEPATRPAQRRFNRRRPSTSPEELAARRFASLSLRNPRQGVERANTTATRPSLTWVFMRRHFGSTVRLENFVRARSGEPERGGSVRKLFLYAILLLREEPEQPSIQRAWSVITNRLILAGVYPDETSVDAAWYLAFSSSPSGLFERLMTEELESVYRHVARLLAED